MKNYRPIYLFTGPVTALVIMLLLAGNGYFYLQWQWKKADYKQLLAETSLSALTDTSAAFDTDDKAVFNFTGDTVLVLAPAKPINWKPTWNVLYKDKYGIYQTEDLPEETLDKIETDTMQTDTQ